MITILKNTLIEERFNAWILPEDTIGKIVSQRLLAYDNQPAYYIMFDNFGEVLLEEKYFEQT